MTIEINGYQVEIKAKHRYSERCNKADVQSVLLDLCLAYCESSNHYKQFGLHALAARNAETYHNIYESLKASGYFKKINEEN